MSFSGVRQRSQQAGYSFLEMLAVTGIVLVSTAIAVLNVQSVLKSLRVDAAFQEALAQVRLARQAAIDERRVYIISFQAPRTIQIQKITSDTVSFVRQITLPNDIAFSAETGIPNTKATTPDGFGLGSRAIDFAVDYGGGENAVYFQPDGSARDRLNRNNNGVIYIARPGELGSSRAISVFGSTGRIRGWRLALSKGGAQWQ